MYSKYQEKQNKQDLLLKLKETEKIQNDNKMANLG